MRIVFDPAKHRATLRERGLDFRDAAHVFAGEKFTFQDIRRDYGEIRYMTIGRLAGRLVVVGWTPRELGGDTVCGVYSMRNASEREIARFEERLH